MLDPTYTYLVHVTHDQTTISPKCANNDETFNSPWHGVWYRVHKLSQQHVNTFTTAGLLTDQGRGDFLAGYSGECRSCGLLMILSREKQYRKGRLSKDTICECQRELLYVWFLICMRLDSDKKLFIPPEIQDAIAQYISADGRLCDRYRHLIFPIGGLQNTFIV